MQEVLTPISTAERLCGKQKTRQGAVYRMSRHCVSIDCMDGRLLYHTLLGSIVLLENGESIDQARKQLIEKWYLVPEDFDENKYADQIRTIAAYIKPKTKHKDHFTIFTTMDCNARCFYCYELGRKREAMTEQTARNAAEYMAETSGGRPLKLFWFGGEPLYNIPAIETITSILREKGIEYRSSMTSNGYYLMPDIVQKAKEAWKMEAVQISMDGTETVYNRTKAYIDACENPFRRVTDNIEAALAAGIRVTIRLNMDSKNAADVEEAIDQLCQRYRKYPNCVLYVALLKSYNAKVHSFKDDEEIMRCFFAVREKIKSYGMLRQVPLNREIKLNRCKADNDACECILPDGKLEKCHHFTEGMHHGSIYNKERNEGILQSWKEIQKDYTECSQCAVYPQCLNLKKCVWNFNGCEEVERRMQLKGIEEQVLSVYDEWKKEKKESIK